MKHLTKGWYVAAALTALVAIGISKTYSVSYSAAECGAVLDGKATSQQVMTQKMTEGDSTKKKGGKP